MIVFPHLPQAVFFPAYLGGDLNRFSQLGQLKRIMSEFSFKGKEAEMKSIFWEGKSKGRFSRKFALNFSEYDIKIYCVLRVLSAFVPYRDLK